MKEFAKKYFSNFSYFYEHLGYRIFLMMGVSIIVGILDGLGLSMFLPLLQLAGGGSAVNPNGQGNLGFVIYLLNESGIPFTLSSVLLFMSIFFILKGLTIFFQGSYEVSVQQYFIRKIRVQNINDLNAINFKRFVLSDVGQIQNTLSGEVDRVSRAYSSYFLAAQQVIMVAVYMGFAFLIDMQFAVLVCLGGILTNILFKNIYRITKGASKELTRYSNFFQGLIIQHVANFKYLKATGLVNKFGAKLIESVYTIESINKKIGILSALLKGAREPLIIIVVSLVIIVQTSIIGSALGPILISLLFFYRALTSLMAMQTAWNYFLGNSGSLANMTEFSTNLKAGEETIGHISIRKITDSIELENASFSYSERSIIARVNLKINRNETIAFVGESGSGKTTLVSLLAGLMPLDSGRMLVDGKERETLKIDTYRQRVGYITQDPVIFNDTIFNNITFWSDPNDHNQQRFENAIKRASLSEFVNGLENRQNEMLGNNGINLSGGQKQRISIARELFKDIDILILDEATSSLDSETEKNIQDNIDLLKGTYTILIVAHRLATVRNADRMVLMSKGEITYIGSFAEMVKEIPHFQRMVALQGL